MFKNIIKTLFVILLINQVCQAYHQILWVDGDNRYNLSTFNPNTGEVDTFYDFPYRAPVNILSYENEVLTYISCQFSSSPNYLITHNFNNNKTNQIDLPNDFDYSNSQLTPNGQQFYGTIINTFSFTLNRFNMDGSQDTSFQIVSPIFAYDIKPIGIITATYIDYSSNTAVLFFNNAGQYLENQNVDRKENDLGVLTCSYTKGCNYMFVFDLNEQTVTSTINLGSGFQGSMYYFYTFNGDTMFGMGATNTVPIGEIQLNIQNGDVKVLNQIGLSSDYSVFFSFYLDGIAFLAAFDANINDPTATNYFIVYDTQKNVVLSNTTIPYGAPNSIFVY